jgi:biotin transport system substrate-specific component
MKATLAQALPRRRVAVELAVATAFAGLTAIAARVQVPLPFTPVPVTGQVLVVLLAGGVLGARLGFISQVQYLAAGAMGLPVFAYGGGPAALTGPTGGYLLGFPVAALVVGAISDRLRERGTGGSFAACLSGVVVIHLFGAAWYAAWGAAIGTASGVIVVLAQSVVPFMAIDAAKAGLAAGLSPALRRRLPFA